MKRKKENSYLTDATRAGLLASLIVTLPLAGCVSVQVRGGDNFATSRLDMLEVGESSIGEVRDALGPAYGKGKSMLPFHDSPRDTWYYYYFEGDDQDARQKILLVYLDKQVYDGYMWFSSIPE